MTRPRHTSKFTHEERVQLLEDLCYALVELKNPVESAKFLQDLLSHQEAEMLARRVKIAKLLLEGFTYEKIQRVLKVSRGTIARVGEWLAISGEGYRLVAERTKDYESKLREGKVSLQEIYNPLSWRNIKRRYPMAFWPQLLVEEIVRSANKKQREKIRVTLAKMHLKPRLYAEIEKAMRGKD